MKRIIKLTAAFLAAASMAAPVFAEPVSEDTDTDTTVTATTTIKSVFTDLNSEDYSWAVTYINDMVSKGLISGYEDGTYRPDNDVTRLEALSLFARAMGSNNNTNAQVLALAHEKYDSVVDGYGLTWGSDEIVYLMYKGALKKTDLDTYLLGDEKNTAMKRYEAAIIITKAMGGENEALSELGVVLDYADAREVPSNAIQYVAYATEARIMEGMGNGEFSPNTAVKRSQMAVMLSRTVDKTDYSFERVNIVGIDTDNMEITADDGSTYTYTDDTAIRSLGESVQAISLSENIDAVLTLSGGTIAGIDVISSVPDETITGKYVSYASRSGKSIITIKPDNETANQSYECSESVVVTYDNSPATVRSFTAGDVVTLELSNGVIVKMTGEVKSTTISNATVESLDIGTDITLTISHANEEYDGKTYSISDDVTVKKNDATVDLDNIYKGDKVSLTLEYGVITKITATSTKKVYEGTIKSITISASSTMTVLLDGKTEETTYQVPKDAEITINGSEGTLYDFRVGDVVKITLDSDAITKIVATSTQESSGSVSGIVTAINSSYGVISIIPEGSTDAKQVFCKDDTTTFVTATGVSKKMKDVAVGQTLEIKGTTSNGVFVGKLVVIVSE